jgi:hypothetical protein
LPICDFADRPTNARLSTAPTMQMTMMNMMIFIQSFLQSDPALRALLF